MSKRLGLIFIMSFLVIGIAMSSVYAALENKVYNSEDTTDATASYKIASEAYDSSNGETVDGNLLKYLIIKAGTASASYELEITNGVYRPDTGGSGVEYYMCAWGDANSDGAVAVDVTELTGCEAFDYTSSKLTTNTIVADAASGSKLVIIEDDDGTIDATNSVLGFNFKANSGLSSGDGVSIKVIEDGTKSSTATIAEIKNQWKFEIGTDTGDEFDSTIDIDAGRKKFVDGSGNNSTTTTSLANVDITDQDTGTNYMVSQVAGGGAIKNVEYTITGSNSAVSKMQDTDAGNTIAYDTGVGGWVYEENGDTEAVAGTIDYKITVTGTDVISTRGFNLDVAGVRDSSDYLNIAYLSGGDFGTWGINAYQSVIPYLLTNASYPTFCITSNTTTGAVNVLFDVMSAEGAAITDLADLDLGSLAGQTTALLSFSGNDISMVGGNTVDVGTTMGADKRYSGKLTITGDANSIFTNCIQTDPATGAKRMVPVLTDDGNIDWRQ